MKNSIKRAQSQACLGFAERKNFRPLAKLKKLSLTLALLITAATGAWAQEETLLTTITATGKDTYSETTPGVVTVTHDNSHFDDVYGWLWWSHAGSITVEAKEGYTITRCVFSQPYKTPFTVSTAPFKVDFIETADPDMPEIKRFLCQGDWILNMDGVTSIEVYGYAPAAGPEVTISQDAETKQYEASFKMPQYDVTATYTIKRDMTVDMPVTVQDAEQNSRFRVQKQGNSFVPVGLTTEQVMALFTVHDDIEEKNLTANTDYTVQIFAVNEEGQKTGEAIPFNDFTFAPGNYVATAVAASNSNYSGETALSNVFTLFQGYEVTVPAGEYVTYYKDEALYVEDTDAKLYTITAVNGDKATATELTVAAAGTPLLVKNNAETEKTILLIPTTNTADNVPAANEFKGTLEATQIAASTTTQNNYAFNGKEFVWVKDALNIAANKAWLSISGSGPSNTRSISIVFDSETTGINGVNSTVETSDGNWYDLNGRKFTTKPTKKGVYIMNGKKVVIKN